MAGQSCQNSCVYMVISAYYTVNSPVFTCGRDSYLSGNLVELKGRSILHESHLYGHGNNHGIIISAVVTLEF